MPKEQGVYTTAVGTIFNYRSEDATLPIFQPLNDTIELVVLIMDGSEYSTNLHIAVIEFLMGPANTEIPFHCLMASFVQGMLVISR